VFLVPVETLAFYICICLWFLDLVGPLIPAVIAPMKPNLLNEHRDYENQELFAYIYVGDEITNDGKS